MIPTNSGVINGINSHSVGPNIGMINGINSQSIGPNKGVINGLNSQSIGLDIATREFNAQLKDNDGEFSKFNYEEPSMLMPGVKESPLVRIHD